ncbi:MAG: SIS domain-containing protein [Oscillospiraceae bacterium]|nr:SIS domain-containing protein [Oscillospiraceae bacterium]
MLNKLLNRYPQLAKCQDELKKAAAAMIDCYKNGGKILLCGNGGSCADCDHIVGELMKGFLKKRPLSTEQKAQMTNLSPLLDEETLSKLQGGLPAISLPSLTALNSAFCNDVDPELIYAQSVMAMGKTGDVLIAMSTSGNAKNVFAAAKVAKSLGLTVIGLTGKGGGKLSEIADICIRVPETETFKVQELHLPVYHYLCAATEEEFFTN